MIKFKINGKKVQGEEGQYVIQVAEKYGITIPTLCHHKALEPAGMCRMCTVELFNGRNTKFVTACNYPIWEGMEINTDTEAVHQGRKLIVEMLYARCPEVPLLKKLAKEYEIETVRFPKQDDDCILCGLCVRMCEKMGNSAISLTGRGVDMKIDTPFGIQSDTCLACGACASVCPTGHITLEKIKNEITKKNPFIIPSEYEMGLKGRKPIYVPYAQAVPNNPAIDRDVCMHFKTGGCQICTEVCQMDAIDHSMEDEIIEIDVGSVILSPGFKPFDPSKFDNYMYSNYPNVMTTMEFERILSASGPTQGHLTRLSDNKEPKKIAWFQCIGSRDTNKCDNSYCSSVCCMYAIKEAMIAKEHQGDDLDCSIFFMDMRTPGKEFERYYQNAKEKHGINFIRSRAHSITEVPDTNDLEVRYVNEKGVIQTEIFDIIVLSVGIEIPDETRKFAEKIGIEITENGFCKTDSFEPVKTSRDGIYVAGAFNGPKDIPESVLDASAAASAAGDSLSKARNTLTKIPESVPEINVTGERPRIGVFVCDCGSNINGVVNCAEITEYARTLPFVEFAQESLYTCSQDTQDKMVEYIKEKNLNRVVVAACTPKTHEPLFQETLTNSGLNKYLFEMTNIRNQNSWVHKNNPDLATEKAKDLVRMAVAKSGLAEPLTEEKINLNEKVVIIGGGIAGMAAAKSLASQGYETHIIEQQNFLGGQALKLYRTAKGEDVQLKLKQLINDVSSMDKIKIHLNTTLKSVDGFVGNFKSKLLKQEKDFEIEHGIAIIATGAKGCETSEYCFGENPKIITSLDLDKMLIKNDPEINNINSAVFIQCVGSRETKRPYCSRVCCTHSIENAIILKTKKPEMDIYILYRDIRTYGEKELLYKKARDIGVIFIRYDVNAKPEVTTKGNEISVKVKDHILDMLLEIKPDIVTLATAIVPNKDEKLANFFKVPINEDNFFVEKHAKLGPAEFATDGVFLCGSCHYPKSLDEAVTQAKASASRALTLLSKKDNLYTSGNVADINPMYCSSCGICVSICPYSAPLFTTEGRFKDKAEINPILCKGCGLCVSSCRSGAIHLKGFDTNQIFAQIYALDKAV